MEGVLGYILKNDSTATINLKDSQKTVEYALLTSQAFDAIKEFSNLFSLGKLESATIECATLKVVLVKIGEYTLNVFMGKTVEPQKVLALLKQFTLNWYCSPNRYPCFYVRGKMNLRLQQHKLYIQNPNPFLL